MESYPTLAERAIASDLAAGTPREGGIIRDMIDGIARAYRRPWFARGFDRYVCFGDSIETHYDGFRIAARIEYDPDSNINDTDMYPTEFDPEMFGEDNAENRANFEHALAVRKAWEDDEWHYVGVALSVTRDGVMLDEHAASLWGIECNYPLADGGYNNGYLLEVANELLPEALEAARAKFDELVKQRPLEDTFAEQLEQLIDSHGVTHALERVAEICSGKAEHIRSNWQDESLASDWDAAAARIVTCAGSPAVSRVSRYA